MNTSYLKFFVNANASLPLSLKAFPTKVGLGCTLMLPFSYLYIFPVVLPSGLVHETLLSFAKSFATKLNCNASLVCVAVEDMYGPVIEKSSEYCLTSACVAIISVVFNS